MGRWTTLVESGWGRTMRSEEQPGRTDVRSKQKAEKANAAAEAGESEHGRGIPEQVVAVRRYQFHIGRSSSLDAEILRR